MTSPHTYHAYGVCVPLWVPFDRVERRNALRSERAYRQSADQ